jgi:predicted regulator of Ras-like GTPase activity (Roadblock/LC7/MglB family)
VPFQYLLTNLLVDAPGARAAIFVDPEGEAVEYVTHHGNPHGLKLEGAYQGIFLRRAGELARLVDAGGVHTLLVAGAWLQVMTGALRDGYYLVLVMEAGAPVALARQAFGRTAEALDREIA